jgi:hypothetical protein
MSLLAFHWKVAEVSEKGQQLFRHTPLSLVRRHLLDDKFAVDVVS